MQEPEEELPPPPGDESAPPEQPQIPQGDDGPVGFWTDLATRLQKELKPPSKGFELPPPPGDESAPPEQPQIPQGDDGPVGFWTDLATRLQKELKPPSKGFFVLSEQAPVHGRLCGNDVIVECANAFTMEMVNVPEVVQMIAAKAGAILGRPVGVKVVDITAKPDRSPQMEQLLSFGKQHKDIVTIKTN